MLVKEIHINTQPSNKHTQRPKHYTFEKENILILSVEIVPIRRRTIVPRIMSRSYRGCLKQRSTRGQLSRGYDRCLSSASRCRDGVGGGFRWLEWLGLISGSDFIRLKSIKARVE